MSLFERTIDLGENSGLKLRKGEDFFSFMGLILPELLTMLLVGAAGGQAIHTYLISPLLKHDFSVRFRWFRSKTISFRIRPRRSCQLDERAMDELSLLSNSAATQSGEVSDSCSSCSPFLAKNPTHVGGPSASKFRGVVSQPNGHWGAQIYANHQRIWLGTFKSENEAAMAYDSAAIMLRNGITNRNFPWTEVTVHEPRFQAQLNTETVLAMIKDGSYGAKFSDYLRVQDRRGYRIEAPRETLGLNMRPLFQKELTPSDVSKLNRLVIPKKYALKFFPKIVDLNEKDRSSTRDVELIFYDRSMKSWNFRYCYWHSSQSFVFTRGWNRFTKEKRLRSKDRVIFSCYDQYINGQKMFIIDVEYDAPARVIEEALPIRVRPPGSYGDGDVEMEDIGSEGARDSEETMRAFPCNEPKKVVRLFGVQIS